MTQNNNTQNNNTQNTNVQNDNTQNLPFDFDDVLAKWRETKQAEYAYIEGKYSPSQLSSDCYRKTWYDIKFPVDFSEDTKKIFLAGDSVHDFVEKVICAYPGFQSVQREERVFAVIPHDLYHIVISGKFDLIVTLKNGEKVMVEVKSTKLLPPSISESYTRQVQLYLWMHKIHKVQRGVILYLEKNTFKFKMFPVPYNHTQVMLLIDKVKHLHQHVVKNTIPAIPGDLNPNSLTGDKSWICRYCSHHNRCIEDDKTQKHNDNDVYM